MLNNLTKLSSNNSDNNYKKPLFYILIIFLIYSVIQLLPNSKSMNNTDKILISLITIFVCLLLDHNMNKKCPIVKCPTTNVGKPSKIENFSEYATFNTKPATSPAASPANSKKSDSSSSSVSAPSSTASSVKSSVSPPSSTASSVKSSVSPPSSTASSVKSSVSPQSSKASSVKSSVKVSIKSKNKKEEKIEFPFKLNFMKKVLKNMMKSTDDNKMLADIRKKSRENEYYEIYIQLLQTNVEAVYRFLNDKNYNKINKLISDIRMKRLQNRPQASQPVKEIKKVEVVKKILDKKKDMKKLKEKTRMDSRELSNTMKKYLKKMLDKGSYLDSNGIIKNIVDNDMKYSMYDPRQQEPLGSYDSTFTNTWDNDYALLNTNKWRPPISSGFYKCKTEKTCPVCPTLTSGYPVKLKEFDMARKILPPDVINVDYINERLLTGLA